MFYRESSKWKYNLNYIVKYDFLIFYKLTNVAKFSESYFMELIELKQHTLDILGEQTKRRFRRRVNATGKLQDKRV